MSEIDLSIDSRFLKLDPDSEDEQKPKKKKTIYYVPHVNSLPALPKIGNQVNKANSKSGLNLKKIFSV